MKNMRMVWAKAQGMVEFALILPLLLLVMFAIIEFGRLLFIYSGVFTSSRDAARYGAAAGDIGGYVAHYQDCAGMRAQARRIGNLVGISSISIEYLDGAGGTIDTCAPGDATWDGDLALGDRVKVTVTAPYAPILPLVNVPDGGWNITSFAARTVLKDINIEGTPSAPIGSVRVDFATTVQDVDEVDDGETVVVNVRVRVNAPFAENVTVDVNLDALSSSATLGDDFTFTSPTNVMVIAGHTYVDLPVTILGDDLFEGTAPETIALTLSNPAPAPVSLGANTQHVIRIIENEDPPTVTLTSIVPSTIPEGSSATLTASLDRLSSLPVTVNLLVTGVPPSPATQVDDFTFNSPLPLVIPANMPGASIDLTAIDDLLDEEDTETALISLDSPVNAVIGVPSQQTLSITDNDLPPTVSFTWLTQQGAEGDDVPVRVSLSAPSGRVITVPFRDTGTGTATLNADYNVATTSPLTIPPGDTGATITVSLYDDDTNEDPPDALDETVILTLDTPTNATLGAITTHILVIVPALPPPQVYFNPAAQPADEDTPNPITVDLLLSAAYTRDLTVNFTAGGTATRNTDYTLASTQVVIPAGSAGAGVDIILLNDDMDEFEETIILSLVLPSPDYSGGIQDTHTVTILDDPVSDPDPEPSVYFTETSQSRGEDAGTMTVTARLSAASGKPVSVQYTVGGTATQGSDYTLSPASPLTFNPGTTDQPITISVTRDGVSGDPVGEPNETVVLTLVNPTNAFLGSPVVHTATIEAWTCPTAGGLSADSGNSGRLNWLLNFAGTRTLLLTQVTVNWSPGSSPSANMRRIDFGGSSIWSGNTNSSPLVVNPSWTGTFATQQMFFEFSRTPDTGTTTRVSATFEHCLPLNASITH